MKKVETHLYEVDAQDILKLPRDYQLLCLNTNLNKFTITRASMVLHIPSYKHYFIFDLPEENGYQTVEEFIKAMPSGGEYESQSVN